MNTDAVNKKAYGSFSEDSTLTIQRRLPGPIQKVWAYLTDSELRAQWLASGRMQSESGTSFELVWRNDRLSASPSERPQGFPEEQSATCELKEIEPPHKLRFIWPNVGDVTMLLEPEGDEVLLTLVHRGLGEQTMKIMVGAGWHTHLDILVARARGTKPPSFWPTWASFRSDYEQRITD
jgi:uncharacterized protein YndB with AHSA1/START domain